MTATKLFDAGYTDLVSVIPPGAELSPLSKVKPESAGKAPGRKNAQGRWVGYGWQNEPCTRADAEKMDADKANVGLKAGRWPGVDIDCTDEAISMQIQHLALNLLGNAPVRVGQAPKRLLMYRTDQPFGRLRLWFTVGEKQHLVEVLGEGQQYVVQGMHPRTKKAYHWTYGKAERTYPPVKPENLTVITKDMVERFFTAIEEELDLFDIVCTREGSGNVAAQRNVAQGDLKAPNLDELAAAVDLIPNDTPSRDEYVRFGYAVKAAAQDDEERGFEIFWSWAERWEGGANDMQTVRGDWDRMHAPFEIGWDFLAQQAARFGYEYAKTEFEAFEVEEEEDDSDAIYLSDIWIAERVIKDNADKFKWVPAWGKWLYWDNACWRKDDVNRIHHYIVNTCKAIADKVVREGATEKERAAALKKALQISSAGTVSAANSLLKSDPRIIAPAEQLDADPWVLGTPGGTIDLKTGEILTAEPLRYITKLACVTPNFTVKTPIWLDFLRTATNGDEAVVKYLQRFAGYCLTGLVSEHNLIFLWGPGGNGKSVFVNTLTGILDEYAKTAPMETFSASNHDRHPTELAGLQGARLVSASETQEGRAWDEAKVKAITGGDPISARYMHQDYFEYEPTFKLMFLGNHKPEIRNLDDAMRRRFHMVPFTVKPKVVDPDLPNKLKNEWPGILAWMIEGCLAWQRDGLAPPQAVLEATREYFEEEDPIGRWIGERCIEGKEFAEVTIDLFNDWKQWCLDNGEKFKTKKWFAQMLIAKGYGRWRQPKTGAYGIAGLELRDPMQSNAVKNLEHL